MLYFIFCKKFNEERNTSKWKRKKKSNMNNYPIQCDLIGINGKIGLSRTKNIKTIVYNIWYLLH